MGERIDDMTEEDKLQCQLQFLRAMETCSAYVDCLYAFIPIHLRTKPHWMMVDAIIGAMWASLDKNEDMYGCAADIAVVDALLSFLVACLFVLVSLLVVVVVAVD